MAENQPKPTNGFVSAAAPVPTQSTEAVAKVKYGFIDFRQHETVLCAPQGGLSTIPTLSLGRVTMYDDHDRVDVDSYEAMRAPYRKKIVEVPKSTMRGRKKRVSLQAMRSKAMKEQADAKDEEGDKEQEQDAAGASPAMTSTIKIQATFRRLSSSLASTGKQMAKQVSSLAFTRRRGKDARNTASCLLENNSP